MIEIIVRVIETTVGILVGFAMFSLSIYIIDCYDKWKKKDKIELDKYLESED